MTILHHTMAESMDTDPCEAYCGVPPYEMECADSLDDAETESIDSEMSEIPPPPVLRYEESVPLAHQTAEEPRLSVREQEIQYIENHGLVAFCHGAVFTAVLQDADYLRAQLTYLRR